MIPKRGRAGPDPNDLRAFGPGMGAPSNVSTIGENFLRTENSEDLGDLGDPELWGQSVDVPVTLLPGATATPFVGGDLCRVQVPQLIARGWDVAWAVNIEFGSTPGLLAFPFYLLDLSWGSGRTRCTGTVDLTSGSPPWVPTTDRFGNATAFAGQLPTPLPAASISATPRVIMANPDPHVLIVLVHVRLTVSPRALS